MTHKTKIPEPVAWVRRHPDGALSAKFLEDAVIESARKESGAWLPVVATTQAEAYADAKVREALEAAITAVESCRTTGTIRDGTTDASIQAIRALFSKQ